jgi:putative ABC transport system permease protein
MSTNLQTTLKVAWGSLLANPLRSSLSMLGIIIGVGAVIAMLALGAGAQKKVLDSITAMGTDLLVVRPGQQGVRGVAQGDAQNLTLADAQALYTGLRNIRQIAPVVSGSVQVKYYNKNARTSLTGTAITYFSVRNFEVGQGRLFTEAEVDASARVAVIGPTTAQTLMGSRSPLGQTLRVNGINVRVVGVTKSKGDQGWFNPDDQVFLPYTTAMKQLLGVDTLREIDIQTAPNANLDRIQQQATRILRRTHRIAPDMSDDFQIRNQAEFIETANQFSQTFTVLLGGIAGISLLVGGIGIMNIMLVSVTERTREIGIRKAIGARQADILLQFLLESVLLSGAGGLIGVVLGLVGAILLENVARFPAIIQPWPIVLSLGFAMAVGIFFGFYPAYRASRLNPIDALRYE